MDKIRSSIHWILRLLPGPLHDTRAVLAVGELRVYVPPEPAPGPHQAACGESVSLYFLAAYVLLGMVTVMVMVLGYPSWEFDVLNITLRFYLSTCTMYICIYLKVVVNKTLNTLNIKD